MPDPEVVIEAATEEEEEKAELAKVADAKAAEADFASGFTGADPTPTEVTPPLVETAPVAEATPEVVVETTPEVVAEIPLAKITDAQFQDVLNKANSVQEVREAFTKYQRDAGGRIGGIEQMMKELQKSSASGQAIEVTPKDFEELEAEGYPDLAKNLAKGLTRILGKAKPVASATPVTPEPMDIDAVVNARVAEGVEKTRQTLAEQRATEIQQEIAENYADWRTITGPKDSATPYRAWLKGQGSAYEALVLGSHSPSTIVKSIDKFKAFEQEKAKKPAVPATGKTTRSALLAEAVPAKGGGGSPPSPKQKTAKEEFAEGFVSG